MANQYEITFYARTGYSISDEPASDTVIDMNDHWSMPLTIKVSDPTNLREIKVEISTDAIRVVDYLKITDTETNERWYYYVLDHRRLNQGGSGAGTVVLAIALDAFATVGLANISFFGNVTRRSLSEAERANYPLLPEPWGPRRPLKTRRLIIDVNVNKQIMRPSHISTTFEEEVTHIEHPNNPITFDVPNSPLLGSWIQDSLAYEADVPIGYPTPAGDTTHNISTPWGSISYTTPYEQYLQLSENALATFLMKAKKYNSLDLIEAPYYLPNPASEQMITISELSNPNTRNPKASRHYTTMTIRSLASNSTQTYSESEARLQYNQPISIIVVPDKNGGIYVLPSTIRDTGLNAYTYLSGVYSPFESVMNNAVGDTPAKFASDGTIILNEAYNNLFWNYTRKINALQIEQMQAKYFKDLGTVKGLAMAFVAEALGSKTTTETVQEPYTQLSTSSTYIPATTQSTSQSQSIPTTTQNHNTDTMTQAYTVNSRQDSTTSTITSSGRTNTPAHTQNQSSYTVNSRPGIGNGTSVITYPAISTTVAATSTTSSSSQSAYTGSSTTASSTPIVYGSSRTTVTTTGHTITSNGTVITSGHYQNSNQTTQIAGTRSMSTSTTDASSRSISEGTRIAEEGTPAVFDEIDHWSTLRGFVFGGYRNEVHSFMLGNINDYINRWVSIQNDMHNGKVANLFKNVTLLGTYNDYNKLVGKYEILIASLQPEDEANYDLFLDHFGHAVDEYTTKLVTDVRDNYNYTMVGEDAIVSNPVQQNCNGQILNQFRTGVRVWKKLVRPGNF